MSNTCYYAASVGNLPLLKQLHEEGKEWTSDVCAAAAAYGHLECLKYAHENGCEWNKHVCHAACKNGHIDCLEYARVNGCEFDELSLVIVCLKYHQEKCFRYLHSVNLHSDTPYFQPSFFRNPYLYVLIAKHPSFIAQINFDDPWWRIHLVEDDSINFSLLPERLSQDGLEPLVTHKREEILISKEDTSLVLPCYGIPIDVIQYILHSYI